MNRRALLALLPLPWLAKLLPHRYDPLGCDECWEMSERVTEEFVCRKPEPPPPPQRITKIDHENRIVTFE